MKINVIFTSTLPGKNKKFWQTVLFPTASVYSENGHKAINLEWLFWLVTIIIDYDGQIHVPLNEAK